MIQMKIARSGLRPAPAWKIVAVSMAVACIAVLHPPAALADGEVWLVEDPCPEGAFEPPLCGATEVRSIPACGDGVACPESFACRRVWHEEESAYHHRCIRPRPPRFAEYLAGPGSTATPDGPPSVGGGSVLVASKSFSSARFDDQSILFVPFECQRGREVRAVVEPEQSNPGNNRLRAVVLSANADGTARALADQVAAERLGTIELDFVCHEPSTHLIGAGVVEGAWPYSFHVQLAPADAAPR